MWVLTHGMCAQWSTQFIIHIQTRWPSENGGTDGMSSHLHVITLRDAVSEMGVDYSISCFKLGE